MLILVALILLLIGGGPAQADPISGAIVAAIGLTGAAASIATTVVNIGLAVGLSFAAKLLTPKAKKQASPQAEGQGMQITTREPLAARRLVYGRTRVSGTIVYQTVSNADKYLHLVIALCEGPIDAVESVYFNDEIVTIDGGGTVTSGAYAGKARVKIYLGDPNQTADAALISESAGQWTSAHRLRGVAYLYCRLEWDQNAWTSGLPNITAVVRGRKLYDPRTNATVWSDNAALAIRDYLVRPWAQGGVGATSAEVDDLNIIAQANICDEAVNLLAGGTEARYAVSGIVDLDGGNTPEDTLQSLLTACGGRLSFAGGVWRLYVAAWRSATTTITDGMLRGNPTADTRISRRDQFNAVKGSYLNPAARYIPADYPAILAPTLESEDNNERVYAEKPMAWTTSAERAQRLAKIELLRSRRAITVMLPCNLMAYQVAVGDTVAFTHPRWGWSAKTFECVGWRWALETNGDAPALGIDLTLRELDSSVFAWGAGEAIPTQTQPATTLPTWTAPDVPGGLDAVSSIFVSTSVFGTRSRTTISWTPAASAFVVAYDVRYRNVDTEPFFTVLPRTSNNQITIDDLPSGTYEVGVRSVNARGAMSAWGTVTRVVDAVYTPPQITWDSLRPGFLDEAIVNPLLTEDEVLVQHFVEGVNRQLAVTEVSSAVDGVSTTVTQQALSITDLQGQTYGSWSVKIATQAVTSGGTVTAISGFGLVQQGGGGTVSSTFAVYADRFAVLPSYSNPSQAVAQRPVFVVGTTPDGAGVGINGNLFVDGSIGARSITVGTLSALTGNVGTLVAGVLQNANGKTIFDLTNGRFVASD